jgi:hypothetical protein
MHYITVAGGNVEAGIDDSAAILAGEFERYY